MASKQKVKELLDMLAGYYGSPVNDIQAKIYYGALRDIHDITLEDAVTEYVKAGKWFPKVSELREYATRSTNNLPTRPANTEYWSAMSTYNDALAGRVDGAGLELYSKYYPEVQDET